MYVLKDYDCYIGADSQNNATIVTDIRKALAFDDRTKAENYLKNIKSTLKNRMWVVVSREITSQNTKETETPSPTYEYSETELEKSGINITDFFKNAVETVSQLRDYAANMDYREKEYNQKILDVRHYKRDIRTKLSAVQLQRLEQFEIQLERERYECKSNRVIAEIFLTDLSRLENREYLEVIKNIKKSEYKPKIFTYELLDEIVGKKRKDKKEVAK